MEMAALLLPALKSVTVEQKNSAQAHYEGGLRDRGRHTNVLRNNEQ